MKHFFQPGQPVFSAKAPGRLDVMGGIADYSGSLLLQMPIRETTEVNIQKRKDDVIHLLTYHDNKAESFSVNIPDLRKKTLQEAGAYIRSIPGGDWAVYPLGCLLILYKEKKIPLQGLSIAIQSSVPWGKGVSSSAALEIATMHALQKAFRIKFKNEELPVLAQMAENMVAAAPCGLMDQLSSHFGVKNKLLPLVCQPHAVYEPVSIPRAIAFTGIDSGIRHAVSGASYADVRTAAFMCYSMIARQEGCTYKELLQAKSSGDWSRLPFGGFLSNIPVEKFEADFKKQIPPAISGAAFKKQFRVSIDPITAIDDKKIYKLLICGSHPVYENHRIKEFKHLLENFSRSKNKRDLLVRMGRLMLQSHQSYSDVGLGNPFTDEIVSQAMKAGHRNGVFGARITGGGNGGTVCILHSGTEGKKSVRSIHEQMEKKMKRKLYLFTGSADGALQLNHKK